MKGIESKTYYELLGVSPEATKDEIKAAYREIARVYHPDSHFFDDIVGNAPPTPDDSDVFKTVTNAYNILTDEQKRAEYDRILPKGLADWDSEAGNWDRPGKRPAASRGEQTDSRRAQAFGTFGRVQEAPKSSFDQETAHHNIRPVSEVLRRRTLLSRVLGIFGFN